MAGGRKAGGGKGGGGGGGRERLMPSKIACLIFSTRETSSSCHSKGCRRQLHVLIIQKFTKASTEANNYNGVEGVRESNRICTWPSHMSSRAALSLVAFASLL